jgi:hypothetical protein
MADSMLIGVGGILCIIFSYWLLRGILLPLGTRYAVEDNCILIFRYGIRVEVKRSNIEKFEFVSLWNMDRLVIKNVKIREFCTLRAFLMTPQLLIWTKEPPQLLFLTPSDDNAVVKTLGKWFGVESAKSGNSGT